MKKFLALSLSDDAFIMLINVGILTFISRINFVLSSVEYGNSFITSGPGLPARLLERLFIRPAFSKPSLVNLISKYRNLKSVFKSAYPFYKLAIMT